MSVGAVRITEFTDPACPFAFSAAPALLALRHHYGDQIEWRRRLVVLSDSVEQNLEKGLTPELVAAGAASLRAEYSMPLALAEPDAMIASLPADLAAKAVELNWPERADAYFRALQVSWHSEQRPIDLLEAQLELADRCEIDREQLALAIDQAATLDALEADRLAARSPLAAARGPLDHKLAGPPQQRRYTCPSLEIANIEDPSRVLVAPGMQSRAVYEVLLANVEPRLRRLAPPTDVGSVLSLVDWPLATAEVAEVMEIALDDADRMLREFGARESDGYWTGALGDEDQLATGAASADRLVS